MGFSSQFNPASPGPIGTTTPNVGRFLTVSANDATARSVGSIAALDYITSFTGVFSSAADDLLLKTNIIGGPFTVLRLTYVMNTANNAYILPTVGGGGIVTVGAEGADTNLDLQLAPKGTGAVRFGTYTAGITASTGTIQIKDSSGTIRNVLVA